MIKKQHILPALLLSAALPVIASCSALPLVSVKDGFSDPERLRLAYSLPKGLISLTIKRNNKGLSLTEPTVEIVPDPDHKYWLEYRPSATSYDDIALAANKKGLLTSINAAVDDQTPEIAEKVVSIISDIAAGPGLESAREKGPPPPFEYTVVFDPFDPLSVRKARELLGKHSSVKLKIALNSPGLALAGKDLPPVLQAPEFLDETATRSVYFRSVAPVYVTVSVGKYFSKESVHVLPDSGSIMALSIRRAPCTKVTNNLTFDDGVLTNVDLDKPSEVLECLAIPANVVRAVLGFPQQALNRKTEMAKAEQGLLKAQNDLLKAHVELEKSRAEHQAALQ